MNKNKLLVSLISAMFISTSAYPVFPKTTAEHVTSVSMDIQRMLQEYVEKNGTAGAVVGLIDHGNIKFFSYGTTSLDTNETVSKDTLFEIGSITKVFTTLALIDMSVKGEVDLDDPIELYLPGVHIPEKNGKKITLRHLATHTSGLPRMPNNFHPKNPLNPYQDYSIENLYHFLNNYTLQLAPGEQFEYSNIGMGLLGHILCLKSGKNYEQLISDLIDRQLGMQNTRVSIQAMTPQSCAHGSHLGEVVEHWEFQQSMSGAGALRSNAQDMMQFLLANIGLLDSPISELLKQCHHEQYEVTPTMGIGLSWILIGSKNAPKIVMHNGGTGGFRSYLGFNRQSQKGIVILTNSTADWPDEFGTRILDPEFNQSFAKDSA